MRPDCRHQYLGESMKIDGKIYENLTALCDAWIWVTDWRCRGSCNSSSRWESGWGSEEYRHRRGLDRRRCKKCRYRCLCLEHPTFGWTHDMRVGQRWCSTDIKPSRIKTNSLSHLVTSCRKMMSAISTHLNWCQFHKDRSWPAASLAWGFHPGIWSTFIYIYGGPKSFRMPQGGKYNLFSSTRFVFEILIKIDAKHCVQDLSVFSTSMWPKKNCWSSKNNNYLQQLHEFSTVFFDVCHILPYLAPRAIPAVVL